VPPLSRALPAPAGQPGKRGSQARSEWRGTQALLDSARWLQKNPRMRDPRRRRLAPILRVALAALGLACFGVAAGGRAEQPTIYKWVDANGVAHYTTDRNRIPSSIRDRIEQRQPVIPAAPAPAPPPDQAAAPWPGAAAPAVAPAPAAATEQAAAPAPAQASVPPAAGSAAPVGGASDLTRDAVPVANPPPATRGVAVAAPPPFYAEPAQAAAPPAADAPRQPAPNAPATIESEGVAPEPTEARRTATAELRPRTPADAVEIAELDRQIADLEAKVAKDEDSLTTLISVPDQQRKGPLVDDPQFREIAKRLPKLQADLQALRERRGKYELAPAPSQ